jgi:hypothetical protein
MWPFKRKKPEAKSTDSSNRCSCCGSPHIRVITHHGGAEDNHIRVWRGRRYLTCRCTDCGKDFYLEEPSAVEIDGLVDDDSMIDDEEALRSAENELKKQIDEDGDRRCWL